MAPKRSKTKASAGLHQPSLSFQTTKPQSKTSKALGSKTPSASSIVISDTEDADKEPLKSQASGGTGKSAKSKTLENQAPPIDDRPKLEVRSKKWDGLRKHAKTEMGGLPAIHAEPGINDIHNILRVFDMTASYGPCVGITRLQRWDRAQKWGLNPPQEIREILLTKEADTQDTYKQSVLYPWLG